jgi:hypothetical protein
MGFGFANSGPLIEGVLSAAAFAFATVSAKPPRLAVF